MAEQVPIIAIAGVCLLVHTAIVAERQAMRKCLPFSKPLAHWWEKLAGAKKTGAGSCSCFTYLLRLMIFDFT
jgi:hypothetical protein